jgi:hypothetical protein
MLAYSLRIALALTNALFLQFLAECLAFNICFGILYLEIRMDW